MQLACMIKVESVHYPCTPPEEIIRVHFSHFLKTFPVLRIFRPTNLLLVCAVPLHTIRDCTHADGEMWLIIGLHVLLLAMLEPGSLKRVYHQTDIISITTSPDGGSFRILLCNLISKYGSRMTGVAHAKGFYFIIDEGSTLSNECPILRSSW